MAESKYFCKIKLFMLKKMKTVYQNSPANLLPEIYMTSWNDLGLSHSQNFCHTALRPKKMQIFRILLQKLTHHILTCASHWAGWARTHPAALSQGRAVGQFVYKRGHNATTFHLPPKWLIDRIKMQCWLLNTNIVHPWCTEWQFTCFGLICRSFNMK